MFAPAGGQERPGSDPVPSERQCGQDSADRLSASCSENPSEIRRLRIADLRLTLAGSVAARFFILCSAQDQAFGALLPDPGSG